MCFKYATYIRFMILGLLNIFINIFSSVYLKFDNIMTGLILLTWTFIKKIHDFFAIYSYKNLYCKAGTSEYITIRQR